MPKRIFTRPSLTLLDVFIIAAAIFNLACSGPPTLVSPAVYGIGRLLLTWNNGGTQK